MDTSEEKPLRVQLKEAMDRAKECEHEEKVLITIQGRLRDERVGLNRDMVRLRERIVQEELDKE